MDFYREHGKEDEGGLQLIKRQLKTLITTFVCIVSSHLLPMTLIDALTAEVLAESGQASLTYPVELRSGEMEAASDSVHANRKLSLNREQAKTTRSSSDGAIMNTKRIVVDVGQCDPDHASIKRVVEQCGVTVERAHSGQEAKKLLTSGNVALVLVNRVLDADGSDGMAIIKELVALGTAPVMLVSNYPEYQEKAVAMGALPGFGKSSLREPTTLTMLKQALGQ